MTNSEEMVLFLQAQDLTSANQAFEKALKEDDPEMLMELAQYLESIGFFPQAKVIYQKQAKRFLESYLSLASIAAEDGNLEEAFSYLEKIPKTSEWYLNSLLVKADLYQLEGLADVAREKLEEAARLSDDPLITFGLAEIDLELFNFQTAIKEYASLDNRAIYEQTGVSTYQRIGVAYASLGLFEVAIEFLEKALELEYEDQTVFELAILLYDQKEYQRANLYFKQLDTISPEFEGYELVYARSLHKEHLTKEALEVIKKGLKKNPFDVELLLFASQLSYELHDEVAAESYLLQAKEKAEDLEEIALRLTTLYLEQGRFDEVLAFEKDQPDQVLTRWNIAKSYEALENLDKALKFYQDLEDDLKDNPEFLEQYSYLLREVGQLEAAKRQVNRYLSLVPDDFSMQELLDSLEET